MSNVFAFHVLGIFPSCCWVLIDLCAMFCSMSSICNYSVHVTLSQYWCTLWRAIMFSCKCRQLSGSCLLICWQVDNGRYCSVELFTCYSFGKWLLPLSEFHNAPGQLKDCACSHIFVSTNLTCSFRTQLNQSRYLGTIIQPTDPMFGRGYSKMLLCVCEYAQSWAVLSNWHAAYKTQRLTFSGDEQCATSGSVLPMPPSPPLHSASHTSLTLSSVQPHECM